MEGQITHHDIQVLYAKTTINFFLKNHINHEIMNMFWAQNYQVEKYILKI